MLADLYIYSGVMLAGLLSFLSPCVLPLVPPYLAYLGGTSVAQMTSGAGLDREARLRVVLGSICFVLGFGTVFVGLGAGASAFGHLIQTYKSQLSMAAGIVIALFGLHFLGLMRIGMLYKEARFHTSMEGASLLGAYVIGLAFAFGWTPCLGPILSAVLTLAAREGSVGAGMQLLAVYTLGLGIPFVLAAVAIGPFMRFMHKFRHHLGTVEKVMGAMLLLTGLLIAGDLLGIWRSALVAVVPGLGAVRVWLGLVLTVAGVVLLFREPKSAQVAGLVAVVLGMTLFGGSMNVLGQWLLDTFPGLGLMEEWLTPSGLTTEIMKKSLGN